LYELSDRMKFTGDYKINSDWNKLQASDHFYYMSTKSYSDGEVHKNLNPYSSPYEAFINYMNVLSDFKLRLDAVAPASDDAGRISGLVSMIAEKDIKIKKIESELKELRFQTKKAKPERKK